MENKKGFTLIEVLVSIILAGIIVYFLYILMLTSYQAYKTLFGVSKETSDIRVCETYLRTSIKNASWIKFKLNPAGTEAASLDFGRQELYWDSGTSTIKNRYVLDRYSVKNSTDPVKTGIFYKDDVYLGNQIVNPRDLTKAGCHELLLQVYYTDSDFDVSGHALVRQEQILTNLRVAYFYLNRDVHKMILVKIGLDFDDYLATGEIYRHTRLFHFAARGYGVQS